MRYLGCNTCLREETIYHLHPIFQGSKIEGQAFKQKSTRLMAGWETLGHLHGMQYWKNSQVHFWLEIERLSVKGLVQGSTVSRMRNGRILHRFSSWLPGGSRRTLSGTDNYCILDCIFHEPNGTYFIMDVMCWKGYSLYDCSTEFRLYWINSKLQEEAHESCQAVVEPGGMRRYSIQLVPAYTCSSGRN